MLDSMVPPHPGGQDRGRAENQQEWREETTLPAPEPEPHPSYQERGEHQQRGAGQRPQAQQEPQESDSPPPPRRGDDREAARDDACDKQRIKDEGMELRRVKHQPGMERRNPARGHCGLAGEDPLGADKHQQNQQGPQQNLDKAQRDRPVSRQPIDERTEPRIKRLHVGTVLRAQERKDEAFPFEQVHRDRFALPHVGVVVAIQGDEGPGADEKSSQAQHQQEAGGGLFHAKASSTGPIISRCSLEAALLPTSGGAGCARTGSR